MVFGGEGGGGQEKGGKESQLVDGIEKCCLEQMHAGTQHQHEEEHKWMETQMTFNTKTKTKKTIGTGSTIEYSVLHREAYVRTHGIKARPASSARIMISDIHTLVHMCVCMICIYTVGTCCG